MSAKTHADAIKALVGATVRLFDGQAPDDAVLPYALLFVDDGTATRTSLASVSDRRDVEFQITAVGADPEGVRSVAERVRTAVLDQRPAVAGRTSSPVAQVTADPLRIDRDITPHRLLTADVYAFSTVPAPA